MEAKFYLLLAICSVICTETKAAQFPDDASTCMFIRAVNARCPISISTANQPLFMESRLQDAVKECDVSNTVRLRNLRIDALTYVSMTSRCGLLFADPEKMEIPDDVMVEVLVKLLSVPTAIPTMNCLQVKRFLSYVTKYLLRFYVHLDQIVGLFNSLGTDNLGHILAVLPGKLCALAGSNQIQIYAPNQISGLVDALAKNCHSRTILSSNVRCSWKDSPNPAVNAMAQTSIAAGGNDSVCIPDGAGARCVIDSPCVKLLCTLDLTARGCDSPCPKPASMSCEMTGTDKCLGTKAEAMSVPLPDPGTATAESLQEFVCCLLRYPRRELKYSDEVLCNLQPPKDSRCMQAFTRWQITHSPKCLNCTGSSHFAALLSPRCRQEAVKMYPTTVGEVKALIMAMSGRRNVLLQLFSHLYKSLDLPLVEIVCIREFMRVVNVENFKKLGPEQLEPVLEAMAMCGESPAPAKVLAVLVKGGTCPFFILEKEGHDLVRDGAITDKCLLSLSTEEALSVCSILMMDKAPRISRGKVRLMCKVLEKVDEENTCVLCDPGRSNASPGTQNKTRPAVSARVRVTRCLRLKLLARTYLTRAQREELKLCKPCTDDSDSTGVNPKPASDSTEDDDDDDDVEDPTRQWCEDEFQISSLEEIEKVLGNLCEVVNTMSRDTGICRHLQCFVKKSVVFYQAYLAKTQGSDTESEYSVLRYLRLFIENNGETTLPTNLRWLRCGSVCPFVKEAYKEALKALATGSRRGKRDTCYAIEVIEGFTQLEDGEGSLTNFLEADELNCLDPEETLDLIRTKNLHLEDWTLAQARVLLNKVLQAVGKQNSRELTVNELRELGLILITLTPEEIADLQDMDPTTFAICGSSILWTKEQHRALVMKYLRQERRRASMVTEDDLFTLQNLINGFTAQEASSFPTDAVSGASAILGELKLCDIDLVSAFINHLKQAHGESGQWDESQLAEFSHLLAGLSSQEMNALGVTIIAHIPDHVWRYHMPLDKYNELEKHLRDVITERQLELIMETGTCSAKYEPSQLTKNSGTRDSGASSGSRGLWVPVLCALLFGLTRY